MLVDGQAGPHAGDASLPVGPAKNEKKIVFVFNFGEFFEKVFYLSAGKRGRRKGEDKKISSPEPEGPGADPGLVVRDHPLVDVLVAGQEGREEDAVSGFGVCG